MGVNFLLVSEQLRYIVSPLLFVFGIYFILCCLSDLCLISLVKRAEQKMDKLLNKEADILEDRFLTTKISPTVVQLTRIISSWHTSSQLRKRSTFTAKWHTGLSRIPVKFSSD